MAGKGRDVRVGTTVVDRLNLAQFGNLVEVPPSLRRETGIVEVKHVQSWTFGKKPKPGVGAGRVVKTQCVNSFRPGQSDEMVISELLALEYEHANRHAGNGKDLLDRSFVV